MRHFVVVVVLSLAACRGGELQIQLGDDMGTVFPGDDRDIGDPHGLADDGTNLADDGIVGQPDSGTTADVDVPRDMAPPPVCNPGDCGPGASCQNNVCTCDDGLLGDPFVGCSAENPCENVNCPAGASCSADGNCACDPFFSGDPATGCDPTPPPADLAARVKADVCAIWSATYARASQDFWLIEPADVCDPGVMHPDEMREALHTASRFRMLVGLNPVSLSASDLENVQDCAMMHDANNSGGLTLNHTPPNTWTCYTQAGYAGCSSSNLAGGINDPAGTVGLYVQDSGVPSLGHRRWVLNPRMGATAFGHRGRFGAMYAFDGSRNHNPAFVAYPAPGAFPRDAIRGKWSIHGGANYTDSFTVTVTNMTTGADVPVSNVTAPVFGNLASTLAWDVGTAQLPVDNIYRITIRDAGGATVREYDTTLVTCN